VRMQNNHYGLRVEGGAVAAVRNCDASGNTNNGFLAFGGLTKLSIDSCTIASNGTDSSHGGVKSESNAVTRISNNMISDNTVGLLAAGGGQIVSLGNNHVAGNISDGAPTSTIPEL
jgi:hypothetical protein